MTDKKQIVRKTAEFSLMASGSFFAMAWPFFYFMICKGRDKKKGGNANRKKWFSLKHTTINHPKYNFLEEYELTRRWCEDQPMEEWYIRSFDDLKLHASYLPAENAKRIVLLSHGYRGTRFGSIAHIAKFLHESGCCLLFIDQRCSGESEGKYITFGAKEQYDVLRWLSRIEEENTRKLPVYLYGQSMGATTVLLASGHTLPDEVKGIIADCGFHSMKQQLRDIALGWFHLRWIELLLIRVDLFCRIFAGFSMKETDVTDALRKNGLQVLFFHGEEDTYVWPENTCRNYTICKAPKEMVFIPGARHLCSSYASPELYQEKITEFFAKNEPSA